MLGITFDSLGKFFFFLLPQEPLLNSLYKANRESGGFHPYLFAYRLQHILLA
jgi:hypothetical protein